MVDKIKISESQLSNVLKHRISEQLMNEDPNKFTTTLDRLHDVDIFGIEKHVTEITSEDNYDIDQINVEIDWRYELDVRRWGIKDITIYTTEVRVQGTVNIWDEGDGKLVNFELTVDDMGGFSSDEGWVYQDEKDDIKLHSIAPENVMVDFNEQLVTVQW
jgi:hypothetical protein